MSDELPASTDGLYVTGVATSVHGANVTPFSCLSIVNQVGDAVVFAGGIDGWPADLESSNVSGLIQTDRTSIYMHEVALGELSGDSSSQTDQINSITNASGSQLGSVLSAVKQTGSGMLELYQSNMLDVPYAAWNEPFGNTPWQSELAAVGWLPQEASLNVNFNLKSEADAASGLAAIADAKALGIKIVLPIISPNYGVYGSFAVDETWASSRALALAGGGLEIDIPANMFFVFPPAYRDFVVQEINWAAANGLTSNVLLSPYATDSNFPQANYDATFGEASRAIVAYLVKANAVPTQWSVENYIANDPSVNQIGSDLDPESVNGVALWVARNAPTSAEPSLLEGINITGSGRPQVMATASLPDNSTATFYSSLGKTSSDGKDFIITGDAETVQNALQTLEVSLGTESSNVIAALNVTVGSSNYSKSVKIDSFAGVDQWSGATTSDGAVLGASVAMDTLVLDVSTASADDVQFTVVLDGFQVAGVYTAHATQGTNTPQEVVITGMFGQGEHVIEINPFSSVVDGQSQVTKILVDALTFDGHQASIIQSPAADTPALLYVNSPAGEVSLQIPVIINVSRPVLQGVAEAGATVQVSAVSGSAQLALGTVTAAANGSWSLTPSQVLGDGSYQITATQTDAAGTTSAIAATQSLTIDTHTPAAPTLAVAQDTLVLSVSEDMWIQNAQFTVAVDGSQVGGTYSTNALHNLGQSQDLTLHGSFGAGAHVVTVNFLNDIYAGPTKDTNLYVNSVTLDGRVTNENSYELLNAGPARFSLNALQSQTASSTSGPALANVSRPVLQGVAEAGATVQVSAVSGSAQLALGTVTAAANGSWSLTPSQVLGDGSYQITATQTDAAGTTSAIAATQSLTIDTHTPAAPTLAVARSIINVSRPVLQGVAEAGATVQVSAVSGSAQLALGTVTAAANGSWSLTPSQVLGDGSYQITATQTDAAGTTSAIAATQSLTIDTHTPAAPTLAVARSIINVSRPVLQGVAEAGATVQVSAVSGSAQLALGTVTAAANGSWSLTPSQVLGDGSYQITATQTDAAGTTSAIAATQSLTIDTHTPAAPTLAVARSIINVSRPVLQGVAEAGATVQVSAVSGSAQLALGTVTAAANGSWSLTPSQVLGDGSYQITATQTDAAGTTSAIAATQSLTIDTHTPAAPTLAVAQDTLVLSVSEDMWIQNAQFTVAVDGSQVGGTYSTNALHNLGQSQDLTLHGSFGAGAHVVTVNFLNDIYAGPTKDTNLYVNSVTLDGRVTNENSYELLNAGPARFSLNALQSQTASSTSGPALANVSRPVLQGVAEAGATVQVSAVSGSAQLALGTVTAAANGSWSLTPSQVLGDGSYQITATQTDAAGTTSAIAATQSLTIDTHTPAAPTLAVARSIINVSRPVLQGVAEAGATVQVSAVSGSAQLALGTVTAAANGSWSLTPSQVLGDGSYQITATQTDAAGTTSAIAATQSLTIDTHTPAAPTLAVARSIINVSRPVLQGVAEAGATVQVSAVSGSAQLALGTVTAAANGSWSLTPSQVLGDGSYQITATQTDAAGTTSAIAATQSLTIDTHTPAAPTLAVARSIINISRPVLQGVAEAGATVQVSAVSGSAQLALGTVTAAANGSWSLTPSQVLGDGSYQITATQTDAAGTTSAIAATQSLTIDTHTPAAPTLAVAQDTLVLSVSEDMWIQNAQFTVAVDGSQVGGTYSTNALHNLGQSQDLTLHGSFGAGAHVVTVNFLNDIYAGPTKDTNLYVNSVTLDGRVTNENSYELLNAGPARFSLNALQSQTASSTSGPALANVSRPVLQGVAEAGATVQVSAVSGSAQLALGTVTAAANGSWSLTPSQVLGDGSYQITATQTDAAGTTSAIAATQSLTIDTHTPAAPTLAVARSIINVSRPVLQGVAEAGATVQVSAVSGSAQLALGTVTAAANGSWSLTPSQVLGDGSYQITATQTDAAGTISAIAATQSLTIDTHTPAAPTLAVARSIINVSRPVLQGVAEAGATVQVSAVSGSAQLALGIVTAAANGSWSLTPSQVLGDGSYQITATQTDAAGTTSAIAATQSLTIDTHTPAAPTLAVARSIINVSRPVLQGVAEAGATVQVSAVSGSAQLALGTVTAAANGSWSLTPSQVLGDGSYQITATQTDAAGTTSAIAATQSLTIDTHTPAAPTLAVARSIINVSRPVLQGVAEAGATVQVSAVSGSAQLALGTVTAAANGSWSLTPSQVLGDGSYQITATQTDAAGTISAIAATQSLTIDTHTPAAPTLAVARSIINISRPVLQGVAEAGATVQVSAVSGSAQLALGTVTAAANGSWSLTPSQVLGDGSYQITATQTDAAGTTSAIAATQSLTIDTHTPAAPTLAVARSIINVSRPVLQGVAEAGATVQVSAVSGSAQLALGTVTAAANGSWSLTPSQVLGDGSYQITATQTDAAGTTSAIAATQSLTIDTHTPAAPTLAVAQDTLVLSVSEDMWIQNAQFTVAVDGSQVGGTYSTNALHNLGQSQDLTLHGSFGAGAHVVTVNFLNDIYAGPTKDTNLYVNSVTLDGRVTNENSYELLNAGPARFSLNALQSQTASSTSGPALANVSRPVLQGVAEAGATVQVSAVSGSAQLALGTVTAAANGSWSLTPSQVLGDGSYQITATQTDAAGTTSAIAATQSLTIDTHTPAAPTLAVAQDTLVLSVSEDMWIQNAQFTVAVDGSQVGGTYSTNALHNLGQSQDLTLHGSFGAGAHVVTVNFLNDIYAGPTKDTNLYVNSVTLDGRVTNENSYELLNAGPARFSLNALQSQTASSTSGSASSLLDTVTIDNRDSVTSLLPGETILDQGFDNTIVFPISGSVTLGGNTLYNGDTFDLRTAMATTDWDGDLAHLGSYLTVGNDANGDDLNVDLHPAGGSGSVLLASLVGASSDVGAFSQFLNHAILIDMPSGTASAPVFISGPDITMSLRPGETLYDLNGINTLVIPAAGDVTLSGNVLFNSDTFDLREIMANTTWDDRMSDLGTYLSAQTVDGGADVRVLLHPTGNTAQFTLATLMSDGSAVNPLVLFEKHSLLF